MKNIFEKGYRIKPGDFALVAVFLTAVTGFIFYGRPISYKEEMNDLLSENSEYYREIRKNGYLIKTNFLPMRYFELRHLTVLPDSATQETKDQAVEEARQFYGNGIYFMVTIGYEDNSKDIMNEKIANFAEWSANLQKFYFKMGEYIYLQTSNENEIKLSVYDFQNTFGYTKDRKMLLCFPKEFNDRAVLSDDSKYVRLNFKEFGFGIGKQSVEWDVDELM